MLDVLSALDVLCMIIALKDASKVCWALFTNVSYHFLDLAAQHADKCEYEHGTLFLSDKTKVGQNMARASWSKAQGEFPAGIYIHLHWRVWVSMLSLLYDIVPEHTKCVHR